MLAMHVLHMSQEEYWEMSPDVFAGLVKAWGELEKKRSPFGGR